MKEGFLWVYKPAGRTSRGVMNDIQRKFKVKGGYEGTLDPFAEGLLIIALGRYTRFLRFFQELLRTYEAVLFMGEETDTLDVEGKVIRKKDVPRLDIITVENVVRGFIGVYEQIPPIYSALKIEGKRAYELAREGKNPELKPRKVYIENIKVLEVLDNRIRFRCRVSSGTYIRALGRDIAYKLGTVGYLESLKRIEIGKITVNEAKPPEEITEDDILPAEKGLYWMNDINLYGKYAKIFKNGGTVYVGAEEGTYRVYAENRFIGVGRVVGGSLRALRLLPQ